MSKLFTALSLLLLCSAVAAADVPDVTKCTITGLLGPPNGIPSQQVALVAPGPLSGTTLSIIVRDPNNIPVPFASVQAIFHPDIRPCQDAVHSKTADVNGFCTIDLRGGGCVSGVAGACTIIANGLPIREVYNVRSPDNAAAGASSPNGSVDIGDLAFFADQFLHVSPAACHDYDNTGVVDIADLPYFGDAFTTSLQCSLARGE